MKVVLSRHHKKSFANFLFYVFFQDQPDDGPDSYSFKENCNYFSRFYSVKFIFRITISQKIAKRK